MRHAVKLPVRSTRGFNAAALAVLATIGAIAPAGSATQASAAATFTDDAVGGQSAFDSREAPSDPPQLAITIG